MMAEQKPINVYGIILTDEERKEWAKREKRTYLEMEIPLALEKKLSKMIAKEVRDYRKKNK